MKSLTHFLKTTEGKFVAFIVALIVLAFGYYFMTGNSSEPTGEVVVTELDHIRGTQGGKVTLVEFGDLQCPACGAYEPLVRQVTKDNAGTLQVVFKHFPLTQIHRNALLAAKASEAAGLQGRFWEMHDMMYDNQSVWSETLTAREIFMGYATALGLDMAQFQKDMDSADVEKRILADYKEGTSLGVQGTPTFFVNGKKINNPGSAEEFNQIIKQAADAAGAQ